MAEAPNLPIQHSPPWPLDSPQPASSSSGDEELLELHATPLTSTPPSENGDFKIEPDMFASSTHMDDVVRELFEDNIIAKAMRTATDHLGALPDAFPEIVSQDENSDGTYSLREAAFWTLGFFPGTLYAIQERLIRFPRSVKLPTNVNISHLRAKFTALCRIWAEPLHGHAGRTDTHDIGFIVMPALRADWELTGNQQSLNSIIRAARSLATRYVPSAKAIRSWDLLVKKDIEIRDMEDNMIVIIDSLCNLDLLYYASEHDPDGADLAEIATTHATTLLHSHLRPEKVSPTSRDCYCGQWYSTCHVANLDPKTGILKRRLTAQGYAHESTWARGQSWAILGYAQTYMFTRDKLFLHACCGLAEYFLYRLENAPASVEIIMADGTLRGRYVPLWDFDAPIENVEAPLRDSSAGMIAANGMLLLSQALISLDQCLLASRFRKAALLIVQDTLAFALSPEKARLVATTYEQIQAEDVVLGSKFEGMLKFGTANNNAQARKRYANHGLVYGDYYLVEFGNQLLRMGYM